MNILLLEPNVKRLLVVFRIKLVAVKLSDPIVNPPIVPSCAVILPVICAADAVI